MKVRRLHPWNVSPTEAICIQHTLRRRLDLREYGGTIETVAGVDVSFDKYAPTLYAAVVVMRLNDRQILEREGCSTHGRAASG